jgi:FkbM family methyltransferase
MSTLTRRDVAVGSRSYHMLTDDQYLDNCGDNFEPDNVALFTRLVKPQDVVADVGANIGLTTMLFSALARQVVSFEPSPSTYSLLRMNVEQNGLKNVSLVNAGLGSKAERSTITFSTTNRSGGFVSDQVQPRGGHVTEQIEICRLDDIWSKHSPSLDFLKVDVEGFELSVLEGARSVIALCRPTVALELNHWCLNAFRRISVPDYFDALRSVFPHLYAVDGNGTEVRDLHHPDQAYEVMYSHIIHWKYPNVVGSFDPALAQYLKHPGT